MGLKDMFKKTKKETEETVEKGVELGRKGVEKGVEVGKKGVEVAEKAGKKGVELGKKGVGDVKATASGHKKEDESTDSEDVN